MYDRDILVNAGIDPHVCFKYDDMYFPYIVLWYSTNAHKSYYQVFYNQAMATQFLDIITRHNKQAILYSWNTNALAYESIASN